MKQKPLNEDNFRSIVVNENGKDIRIRNPLSFYHKAYMEYRADLKIEDILLFEKLIVVFKALNFQPFAYQQDRLEEQLRIKRTRLENARRKLVELEILKEVTAGRGLKIMYSIDGNRIISLIPYLYKMPDDPTAKKSLIKELETFFSYHFDRNFTQKSIYGKDYKGKKSISGPDNRNIKRDISE
jgi:hypothetical protein